MASRFTAGDAVQTPFGKGVLREVRNGGRLMVDVEGRTLVLAESEVSELDPSRKRSRARTSSSESGVERTGPKHGARSELTEIDLHGLTVEEALQHVQQVLSQALLADVGELRLIHGRSGGRIRAALHRRLREISSVRFRLDPRNPGVTIVSL